MGEALADPETLVNLKGGVALTNTINAVQHIHIRILVMLNLGPSIALGEELGILVLLNLGLSILREELVDPRISISLKGEVCLAATTKAAQQIHAGILVLSNLDHSIAPGLRS